MHQEALVRGVGMGTGGGANPKNYRGLWLASYWAANVSVQMGCRWGVNGEVVGGGGGQLPREGKKQDMMHDILSLGKGVVGERGEADQTKGLVKVS